MCFVLYQIYHVSGQAGVRTSKEEVQKEKRTSSSPSDSNHPSNPAPTVKHLTMKFPLVKWAGLRFGLGQRWRGCIHSGEWESTSILCSYTCCEILGPVFFLSLQTETGDLGKHDVFFNSPAPQSLRSCHLFRRGRDHMQAVSLFRISEKLLGPCFLFQ